MDDRIGGSMKCQLCGETSETFGTLIDPVGHKWRICKFCIEWWWDNRQELNVTQRARSIIVEELLTKLRRLLEND
jgi:hypothetical protein